MRAKGEARGRWTTGAPLPDALGEVSTAVIDGRLFVVGEGSSKTYALDLATGTWDDTLATRPYTGSHHAAQVVGGRLFLIGGLGAGYGKVQIYDPATDAWSLGADMPWSGGSCSSAVIDGLVYVCGGIVGSSTVANLAACDPVVAGARALRLTGLPTATPTQPPLRPPPAPAEGLLQQAGVAGGLGEAPMQHRP